MISGNSAGRKKCIGVLLEYGEAPPARILKSKVVLRQDGLSASPLNIGFIGAGNFAQASLLPPVQSFEGAKLVGVCTANGLNATNVAKSFGFQFATTAAEEIIESKDVGTVFIATRHNLHAKFAVEALKAGKNVFVEKPLALTEKELSEIQDVYQSLTKKRSRTPVFMVGFNRRFAPLVRRAKRFFENAVGPFAMQYRINAGYLPPQHWTQDTVEGGGRILGEVCHFVDLVRYFANSDPLKVFAEAIAGESSSPHDDSVAVTIKFVNGSLGVITYLANGDQSLPKEYMEIFSTGRTAVIDNFQTLKLYQQATSGDHRLSSVDKGHRDEVREFLSAVKQQKASPIPFDDLVKTTKVTFRILSSLKLGIPIKL